MTDTIYTLIPKIREEVGAVRKDQTAQAGARYSYRSGDQVINALVPILNKYGVFTTVEDVDHDLSTRDVGNKVVTVAKLRKVVTFYAPDGSSVSSTVASESSDYADKATGAAQAYAYRYALLQTFTLPTDETDPDAVHEEKVVEKIAAKTPSKPSTTALRAEVQNYIKGFTDPESGEVHDPIPANTINEYANKKFGVDRKVWVEDVTRMGELVADIKVGKVK